jgi:hypothetical protein
MAHEVQLNPGYSEEEQRSAAMRPSRAFVVLLIVTGRRSYRKQRSSLLHAPKLTCDGFSGMAVSEATGNAPPSIATLTYQPVLDRIRQVPGVRSGAYYESALVRDECGTSSGVVGQAKASGNKLDARISAVRPRRRPPV